MTGFAAVLVSFSLYVLTHWAICRYLRWRPLSKVLNLSWLCFIPVYVVMFFVLSQSVPALAVDLRTIDGIANLLNGMLFNVFFLLNYTVFFFLIERGLSLRVMIHIDRAKEGRLTLEDIKRVYTYDYILKKRLGQMFAMGYAVQEGKYICSTKKAATLIRANRLVRKIFLIEQVMP
jgi:hypothetical protein